MSGDPLSETLVAARDLLAASPSFQEWVGSDPASTSVHLLVARAQAPRPFALIDFNDFVRERDTATNRVRFRQRSSSALVVWFQADVPPSLDDADAALQFCSNLGRVWLDLELAAGSYQAPSLGVHLIELAVPPIRIAEEERETAGDFYEAALSVSFTRSPSHG